MSWKDMIHDHVVEESKDNAIYEDIARMAEEDGCHHEAGVLRDIAHEEHIHKKLLMEMLGK